MGGFKNEDISGARVLIAKCKMLNINLYRGCIFAYVGRIFQMAVVFSDISCKNPFMQGFNLPQSSITLSLAFSMMKSFQSKCHTLCLLLNKYYLFWLMYILVGYILGCFRNALFQQQKNKCNPVRTPPGYIKTRSKIFFS